MSDFSPVGLDAKPPDAVGTLSSILGIQQRKQALVTGQATQQSAQAEAQASQQAMQERQLLQQTMKSGVDEQGKSILNENNEVDPQKMISFATRALPMTGQPVVQNILKTQSDKVNLSKSVADLSNKYKDDLSGITRSFINNPNAKADDVTAAYKTYAQANPDAAPAVLNASELVKHLDNAATQKDKNDQLLHLSQQFQPAARTAEQQAPSISTYQSKQGLQPIQTNPLAPGGLGATGAALPQGVAPAVTQLGTGQLGQVGPGGTVAPLSGAANLNTQQQTTFASQGKGIAERVEQAKTQANNTVQAQDALNRAKAILESPSSPKTGANFESIKNLKNTLSSLGIDTQGADDMNTLAKNLARFEASRATAVGLGGTDAARDLAHAGSPNTQIDNKALLGIVNQSLASEKALASYARVQSKTNDPQALVKNENDFRNIPHLIEAHEYGMSRNKDEADSYLHSHGISREQMKASRDAIKEFDSR